MSEPPSEWIYESGIGENRAARIQNGTIVELRVERASDGVPAGTIAAARLLPRATAPLPLVRLADGEEAVLRAISAGVSEGRDILVEITRSALSEVDVRKRALARLADEGALPHRPSLLSSITASGTPVRTLHPHQPDALEDAGWSEWLECARIGHIPFTGGLLRLSLTPAMAVFDVDGTLPPAQLAQAGAGAAARAILALGIAGNIVIDLPTLANKAERIAAADAIDAALPPPFERTAVNGYGLIQIIRPRARASIAERLQFARVESAALALLRRAQRACSGTGQTQRPAGGGTALTLIAAPALITWLGTRPELIDTLTKACARQIVLQADAARAIDGGDVQ